MNFQNRYSVYLVEDDEILAKIVTQELSRSLKCDIKWFGTGEELIANLEETPDIIVLDYFLPGMNGAEVYKKLKAQNIESKVIAVSGQAQYEMVANFFKSGVEDYVEKDTQYISKLTRKIKDQIEDFRSDEELEFVEFDNDIDKKIVTGGVVGLLIILSALVYLLD